jgi:hypothetical protein
MLRRKTAMPVFSGARGAGGSMSNATRFRLNGAVAVYNVD